MQENNFKINDSSKITKKLKYSHIAIKEYPKRIENLEKQLKALQNKNKSTN